MDDLELMTTPLITLLIRLNPRQTKHDVQIYFDATPQWAVNTDNQPVKSEKLERMELPILKQVQPEQNIKQ